MSETVKRNYIGVGGFVQQFPDQDVIRNVPTKSNGIVRHFTIRAFGSQKLVDVGLFDQWEHVEINAEDLVFVEGPDSTNVKGDKTYPGVQAYRLHVNGVKQVAKRLETVNTGGTGTSEKVW